ncbi:MAG: histone deacetylase [Methanospirillaceae archaeon]|nr:histone deacetylase [Methanospirillaceae archaeon]
MRTGIVYHDRYLAHEQYPSHPERRERLSYTMDQLEEEGIFEKEEFLLITPKPASISDILAVHEEDYLTFLERSSVVGGYIDADTNIPPGLYQNALLSAGGAVAAGDAVLDKKVRNAFAFCRPPGHHAGKRNGAGFCYLNNMAVLVQHVKKRGLKRVAIIDWDAHHGNGTQEIFYPDSTVLFFSVHQYPFYPGTGGINESGTGAGRGYTINMPVPAGTSDESYEYLFTEIIAPVIREFSPDCVTISAGQDAHFTDPLISLALTTKGYATLMHKACALADELCKGRLIAILEGGYSVCGGLPYTNLAILACMAGLDTSHCTDPQAYMSAFPDRYNPRSFDHVRGMTHDLKKILSSTWNNIR